MKKVLIATAVLPIVAMAMVAAPALAFRLPSATMVTNYNSAIVTNSVNTTASTGGNAAYGGLFKGGMVASGAAEAVADVTTGANTNTTVIAPLCGLCSKGNVSVSNANFAGVTNNVGTNAYTGSNAAYNGGVVVSGAAYAGSAVSNYLNSSVTQIY